MSSPQPIPDHVKRQAMSAIGHSEVAAMMRRMSAQHAERPAEPANSNEPSRAFNPLSPEAKRQAMDAVSHPEVRAHVRMLEETGSISPAHSPNLHSRFEGRRIDGLYRAGQSADTVHQKVTKNDLGRQYV